MNVYMLRWGPTKTYIIEARTVERAISLWRKHVGLTALADPTEISHMAIDAVILEGRER